MPILWPRVRGRRRQFASGVLWRAW